MHGAAFFEIMKKFALSLLAVLLAGLAFPVAAQVPQIINYQGRMTVGGVNFNGNGQFKFALVDGAGTTLWSNAPISGGQPNAHVVLPVTNGIYNVFLGDTTLANMAAIPTSAFAGADVRVRIWFNNGVLGFQQLAPDQRIAAVGYAIMADGVKDGAITSSKIAAGAVTSAAIANGAVGSAQLAAGAVTGTAIANGSLTGAAFADGAISGTKLAAGSVTGAQIADGTIPATKLQRPYDSGTFSVYGEDLTSFPASLDKTIPFSATFLTVPTVSLGLQGEFATSLSTPPNFSVQSRSLSGFTLRTPLSRLDHAVMPVVDTTISSTGVVTRSVTAVDMVMLATGPALAYVEEGTLLYRRASNIEATAWENAVSIGTVDSGTRIYLHLSAGNPAIALTTGAGVLRFTRATDTAGTAWGGLTTVVASGVNSRPIGGRANTNPGIVVHDAINKRLQFYRATTATGSTWAAAVNLTATNGCRAEHWDFTTVNGSPALAFSSSPTTDLDADLFYVRAAAADGSTWPASATAVRQDAANTRIIGNSPRFLFVNGKPAIFHIEDAYSTTISDPSGTEGASRTESVQSAALVSRSSDASGTGWVAPVSVGSDVTGPVSAGMLGAEPVIGVRDKDTRAHNELKSTVNQFGATVLEVTTTYSTSESIQFLRPGDADGNSWNSFASASASSQPDRVLHSLNGKLAWLVSGSNDGTIHYKENNATLRRELPRPSVSTAQTNGALATGKLQDGTPYVTVFDPGDKTLKFAKASDAFGAAWQSPTRVAQIAGGQFNRLFRNQAVHRGDSLIFEGPFGVSRLPVTAPQTYSASLGEVAGIPAVVFTPATGSSLHFARATGYDGLAWNAPVQVLASGSESWEDVQLLTVNGNPAVFYSGGGAIRMVRATDTQGTAWAAPVTIAADPDFHFSALGFKAVLIAGNPAVAYCAEGGGNFRVRFRRATDASGTTWPAATNAITQASAGTGGELNTIALAEISGTPAIALSNAQTGKLFYSRSTVVAGTSGWGAPVELDAAVGVNDSFSTQRVAMVAGPKPVILYNKITFDNVTFVLDADLRCVIANDATGSAWSAPRTLIPDGLKGEFVSLAMDGPLLRGACYDAANASLLRLRSMDNGANWEVEAQGNAFTAGEHHTAITGATGGVSVYYQKETGLWVRGADATGTTWGAEVEVAAKITPGSPGKGNGFFPSAAVVGGLNCVSYYDADNGDLYFKRGNFVPVLVQSTKDVGGYSSLAEVNGAACIAYYDFTNKNLKFARLTAAGTSVEAFSFPESTPGNGEHCQLIVLGGKPAILYYSAASKDLRLVRSTDVNGYSWAAPEVVDRGTIVTGSGIFTSESDIDVGRFCRIAMINGRPCVSYYDGPKRRILYRRANDATGTTWGLAIELRGNSSPRLFPVLSSVSNAPSVFFFDEQSNAVNQILPTHPFSVGWTAVEE
ncbi:MAG: hypothetical protein RL088_1670 [Verrucomicrobiota bacterium]